MTPTGTKKVNTSTNTRINMRRTIPTTGQNTNASYDPLKVSKNDIIYCGNVVIKAAQSVLDQVGQGAQYGKVKSLATDVVSKGVSATMTPFINTLFSQMQFGLINPNIISNEEFQCLKATLWYENQLAQQGGIDGIEFLKESIIYSVPGNGNGNENGANASTGNEDESDFTFVALGLGGLAVLGLGLWYINYKKEEEEEDMLIPASAQRFSHPAFN